MLVGPAMVRPRSGPTARPWSPPRPRGGGPPPRRGARAPARPSRWPGGGRPTRRR